MLSEINQAQKDKCHMTSLISGLAETENRMMIAREGEASQGVQVSIFAGMNDFWRSNVQTVFQTDF